MEHSFIWGWLSTGLPNLPFTKAKPLQLSKSLVPAALGAKLFPLFSKSTSREI
jgi:hypothetical protein